ncbi:MAG: hypothetical protein JNL70_09150 [Saprospiraceae bacterium]|nr:hypothetical protein [Saprospiraceae bacterium]
MSYQRTFRFGGGSNNPFGSLLSLLIFVGVLVALFFMVTGFVKLLYLVAPVLLIATLLINYKIVADYVLGVFETFQTDVLFGVVKVLFSVFCYPFVIGWLFAKAMFHRKMNQLQKDMEHQMGSLNHTFQNTNQETQYTDYEEISSDTNTNEPTETPKIIELPKPKDKLRDDFDQYFKQ